MTDRDEFVHGLRELADFLEANEVVPHPEAIIYFGWRLKPEDWGIIAAAMAPCEKDHTEGYAGSAGDLILRRQFSGVRFEVRTSKESTCQKVEVGTRTERKLVVPPDMPPLEYEDVEVPVYEWKCPDSFLAAAKG